MNVFRDRQQFRKTLFFNHHFDCTKFFQEIFSPLSSDGWRCVSAIISFLKNVQIMLESGNTFNCILCTLNIIYNKKNYLLYTCCKNDFTVNNLWKFFILYGRNSNKLFYFQIYFPFMCVDLIFY